MRLLLLFVPCLFVAMLTQPLRAAAAAAAAAAAPAASRPGTPDAQPTEIQRRVLLASLSAYSLHTRQDAQKKLMGMRGESVEAGLVHAAATAVDADARERARIVLEEMRTQRRIRELMEPTRISLHFDQAPARQVLASLYVRAGAQPRGFPPDPWESAGDDPVTVHLDNVPFWDAVRKLEELTGLTLFDAGWGARFIKARPELVRERMTVHGPFRIVAEDGPMPGSIASLKVFLEPKIRVVSHARLPRLLARDDQQGKPLAFGWVPNRQATARVIGRSDDVLDVELPLDGAIRPVTHVKGTVPASLAVREEVIEGGDAVSGRSKIAEREFTWWLQPPVAGGDDVHLLRVEEGVRQPLWTALPASTTDVPLVRPTLHDHRGTPLLRSPNVKVSNATGYEWAFYQTLTTPVRVTAPQAIDAGDAATQPAPPPCGPPVMMKLTRPTVTREIEIPFEFGDLPRLPPAK